MQNLAAGRAVKNNAIQRDPKTTPRPAGRCIFTDRKYKIRSQVPYGR